MRPSAPGERRHHHPGRADHRPTVAHQYIDPKVGLAVTTVSWPYAIMVVDVNDSKVGHHQHLDMIYACWPRSTCLTHQGEEVMARTMGRPHGDVRVLPTLPELHHA